MIRVSLRAMADSVSDRYADLSTGSYDCLVRKFSMATFAPVTMPVADNRTKSGSSKKML